MGGVYLKYALSGITHVSALLNRQRKMMEMTFEIDGANGLLGKE